MCWAQEQSSRWRHHVQWKGRGPAVEKLQTELNKYTNKESFLYLFKCLLWKKSFNSILIFFLKYFSKNNNLSLK